MNINVLKTFLTVDRSGGFNAAAEQMNLTQTAVSARIRQLEEALQAELFIRGPAGTQLSEAGRHFRIYAEQIVRTWEYMNQDMTALFQNRVSMRLGVQISIWDELLVDLTVWLEEYHQKIPFMLNFDHWTDMQEAVEQRSLDLAITHEAPLNSALQVHPLPAEQMILVADQAISFNEASQKLFINLELGHEYEQQTQAVFPDRKLHHLILGHAQMGLKYLLKRGGVGYFPAPMVKDHLAENRLFRVTDAPEIEIPCHAIYLAENPAVDNINDLIKGLELIRAEAQIL